MEILQHSRRLERGEMDLQMGNRAKVVAIAIGRVDLKLPSGMVLVLNNIYCYEQKHHSFHA